MAARVTRTDAFELVDREAGGAPVVLTCEHASARLPEPMQWDPSDWRLYGTHWSYDIGAAELTASLAENFDCPAVLSRFSRLFCDANRHTDAVDLFRPEAEGLIIEMNREITAEEGRRRIDDYYRPFHDAIDRTVRSRLGAMVLSLHSFTPVWKGVPRELEVGVLFDHNEALAIRVARVFEAQGLRVRLNEPYSGRDGGMFSAEWHGVVYGRPALEIEVRQDLAGSRAWRERFVGVARTAFEEALRASW